jgi:hypothetical protein
MKANGHFGGISFDSQRPLGPKNNGRQVVLAPRFKLVSFLLGLIFKADDVSTYSSEMPLEFYLTAQRRTPRDKVLHSEFCENFDS